jgi:hypothetical protein
MNKEILIDINGTGAMKGLHFEDFSLLLFGEGEIRRATDIKFNSRTQRWDINLLDHDESIIPHHPDHLAGFESYETARGHEVRYLQECRLREFGIVSQAADDLGAQLREAG